MPVRVTRSPRPPPERPLLDHDSQHKIRLARAFIPNDGLRASCGVEILAHSDTPNPLCSTSHLALRLPGCYRARHDSAHERQQVSVPRRRPLAPPTRPRPLADAAPDAAPSPPPPCPPQPARRRPQPP